MNEIAKRIRQALDIRQMSQAELCKRTGISKGSISQYINSYVEPKQDRIYLMAQALQVDPVWLMGVDVGMTDNVPLPQGQPLTDDEQELLSKYRALSDINKGRLLEHINQLEPTKKESLQNKLSQLDDKQALIANLLGGFSNDQLKQIIDAVGIK